MDQCGKLFSRQSAENIEPFLAALVKFIATSTESGSSTLSS